MLFNRVINLRDLECGEFICTYGRDDVPDCVGIVLDLLHELIRKARSVLAYVDRNHVFKH